MYLGFGGGCVCKDLFSKVLTRLDETLKAQRYAGHASYLTHLGHKHTTNMRSTSNTNLQSPGMHKSKYLED